jgi:hypothetical protein
MTKPKSDTYRLVHPDGTQDLFNFNPIEEARKEAKLWCTECNGEDEASVCKWCYEDALKGKFKGICRAPVFTTNQDAGKSQFKGDLLRKSNHILGCMLECYCNILELRGFNEEAKQLGEIASKIK